MKDCKKGKLNKIKIKEYVAKMDKLYKDHPLTYLSDLKIVLDAFELYQKGFRGRDIKIFAKDKRPDRKTSLRG